MRPTFVGLQRRPEESLAEICEKLQVLLEHQLELGRNMGRVLQTVEELQGSKPEASSPQALAPPANGSEDSAAKVDGSKDAWSFTRGKAPRRCDAPPKPPEVSAQPSVRRPARGHHRQSVNYRGMSSEDIAWAQLGCGGEDAAEMESILPTNWPLCIEPRVLQMPVTSGPMTSLRTRLFLGDEEEEQHQAVSRPWRDPMKPVYVLWGSFALAALAYELTFVPWLVAWDAQRTDSQVLIAVLIAIYWSLDFVLNFYKGYFSNGDLVDDPRKIVKHYLKSWFLVDLQLILLDWLTMPFFNVKGGMATSKLARFVKVGKAVRVLELFKVIRSRYLAVWSRQFHKHLPLAAEYFVVFKIGRTVVLLLWTVHLLSCLWFVVGKETRGKLQLSWVVSEAARQGDVEFMDTDNKYQYFTSLHWALAQVTMGSMEVVCCNYVERMFTIWCLLLGLVVGSAFISTLSANIIEFRMLSEGTESEIRLLQRYLEENGIQYERRMALMKEARERLKGESLLSKDSVPVLQLLPTAVQRRLHAEICSPLVKTHPLIFTLNLLDEDFVVNFCEAAVDVQYSRMRDCLFAAGSLEERALYLITGTVEYVVQVPTPKEVEMVTRGTWMCEVALWCKWSCVGTALAASTSQYLAIDGRAAWGSLKRKGCVILAEYIELYHARVVSAVPPQVCYPTDLEVPHTGFSELVSQMGLPSRVAIAGVCVKHYARQHEHESLRLISDAGLSKVHEDILKEVERGKSIVTVNSAGQVQRIVHVVIVQLRQLGLTLFELGEVVDGQVGKVHCRLPAVKRQDGESSDDALHRILVDKLGLPQDYQELLSPVKWHTETETSSSHRYGFPTAYLRDVHCFDISTDFEFLTLEMPVDSKHSVASQGPVVCLAGSAKRGTFIAFLSAQEAAELVSPEAEGRLRARLASTVLPEDQASEPEGAEGAEGGEGGEGAVLQDGGPYGSVGQARLVDAAARTL